MRAPVFIGVSGFLFVCSVTVLALLQFPDRWEEVPFQWWLHLAILIVLGLGFWELHRLRRAGPDHRLAFFRGFPVWLMPLGLVAVLLAAPNWSPSKFDLGTTSEGEQIHRQSTYEKDGKYFLRLNDKYTREISRAEYLAIAREGYEFFARGWVLASFLSIAFWHYLWRRRRSLDHAG